MRNMYLKFEVAEYSKKLLQLHWFKLGLNQLWQKPANLCVHVQCQSVKLRMHMHYDIRLSIGFTTVELLISWFDMYSGYFSFYCLFVEMAYLAMFQAISVVENSMQKWKGI